MFTLLNLSLHTPAQSVSCNFINSETILMCSKKQSICSTYFTISLRSKYLANNFRQTFAAIISSEIIFMNHGNKSYAELALIISFYISAQSIATDF